MFVFLFLLLSCWVVIIPASLMAEKTNVGVVVFVADNASMCGFGSDGVAALLSVYSPVRCCSREFVFACFKVLFKITPPLCAIRCKAFRGHSVDVVSLHICDPSVQNQSYVAENIN